MPNDRDYVLDLEADRARTRIRFSTDGALVIEFLTWGSSNIGDLSDGKGIWLGTHAGLMVYLVRHVSPVIEIHEVEEILAQTMHAD